MRNPAAVAATADRCSAAALKCGELIGPADQDRTRQPRFHTSKHASNPRLVARGVLAVVVDRLSPAE